MQPESWQDWIEERNKIFEMMETKNIFAQGQQLRVMQKLVSEEDEWKAG